MLKFLELLGDLLFIITLFWAMFDVALHGP
jgi:hypothetical protein